MTTPDELEQAVERLTRLTPRGTNSVITSRILANPDGPEAAEAIRALLSERAELLATVERLETALTEKADEGMLVLETLAALSPNNAHRHVKEGLAMARKARAALTTGEEK